MKGTERNGRALVSAAKKGASIFSILLPRAKRRSKSARRDPSDDAATERDNRSGAGSSSSESEVRRGNARRHSVNF